MTIFAARLSRRWFSKHLEEGRESERVKVLKGVSRFQESECLMNKTSSTIVRGSN